MVRLAYRRRRVRRLRLVLLCDVSGSMDVYSRFLAQFLFGLPVHNLESLARVGRALVKLARG